MCQDSWNTADMLKQHAGRTILLARSRQGLTQDQLSERSGVSVNTIVAVERHNKAPRMVKLLALADALDLTVEDLLTDAPQEIAS